MVGFQPFPLAGGTLSGKDFSGLRALADAL
jgi:hypothetical protein